MSQRAPIGVARSRLGIEKAQTEITARHDQWTNEDTEQLTFETRERQRHFVKHRCRRGRYRRVPIREFGGTSYVTSEVKAPLLKPQFVELVCEATSSREAVRFVAIGRLFATTLGSVPVTRRRRDFLRLPAAGLRVQISSYSSQREDIALSHDLRRRATAKGIVRLTYPSVTALRICEEIT